MGVSVVVFVCVSIPFRSGLAENLGLDPVFLKVVPYKNK